MDENAYQELLAELKTQYGQELPAQITEIIQAWEIYSMQGWTAESHKTFLIRIHRVTGSAATFGFNELSELSGEIELLLKNKIIAGEKPAADVQQDIQTRVQQLKSQIKA